MGSLDAFSSYGQIMALVASRFEWIDAGLPNRSRLEGLEHLACQVRKIVESVAWAALSAAELRSKHTLNQLRSKDANDVLGFLGKRGMLRLPNAQDYDGIAIPPTVSGRGDRDLSVEILSKAFSAASVVLHERHPERRSASLNQSSFDQLREFSALLRSWLWTHSAHTGSEMVLIRMDQPVNSNGFMIRLGQITCDIPADHPSQRP